MAFLYKGRPCYERSTSKNKAWLLNDLLKEDEVIQLIKEHKIKKTKKDICEKLQSIAPPPPRRKTKTQKSPVDIVYEDEDIPLRKRKLDIDTLKDMEVKDMEEQLNKYSISQIKELMKTLKLRVSGQTKDQLIESLKSSILLLRGQNGIDRLIGLPIDKIKSALQKYKVQELKTFLKERKLRLTGNKSQLIDTLAEHLNTLALVDESKEDDEDKSFNHLKCKKYTISQLRTFAVEYGIEPTGTKTDLCRKLIKLEVKRLWDACMSRDMEDIVFFAKKKGLSTSGDKKELCNRIFKEQVINAGGVEGIDIDEIEIDLDNCIENKVADLKLKLKSLGLSYSGTKSDLCSRLKKYYERDNEVEESEEEKNEERPEEKCSVYDICPRGYTSEELDTLAKKCGVKGTTNKDICRELSNKYGTKTFIKDRSSGERDYKKIDEMLDIFYDTKIKSKSKRKDIIIDILKYAIKENATNDEPSARFWKQVQDASLPYALKHKDVESLFIDMYGESPNQTNIHNNNTLNYYIVQDDYINDITSKNSDRERDDAFIEAFKDIKKRGLLKYDDDNKIKNMISDAIKKYNVSSEVIHRARKLNIDVQNKNYEKEEMDRREEKDEFRNSMVKKCSVYDICPRGYTSEDLVSLAKKCGTKIGTSKEICEELSSKYGTKTFMEDDEVTIQRNIITLNKMLDTFTYTNKKDKKKDTVINILKYLIKNNITKDDEYISFWVTFKELFFPYGLKYDDVRSLFIDVYDETPEQAKRSIANDEKYENYIFDYINRLLVLKSDEEKNNVLSELFNDIKKRKLLKYDDNNEIKNIIVNVMKSFNVTDDVISLGKEIGIDINTKYDKDNKDNKDKYHREIERQIKTINRWGNINKLSQIELLVIFLKDIIIKDYIVRDPSDKYYNMVKNFTKDIMNTLSVEDDKLSTLYKTIFGDYGPRICKNESTFVMMNDIEDIPTEKYIKLSNGYCYDIDELIESLIMSKDENINPSDPTRQTKIWRDQKEKDTIINHKGIDPDLKKRYDEMIRIKEDDIKRILKEIGKNTSVLDKIAEAGFKCLNDNITSWEVDNPELFQEAQKVLDELRDYINKSPQKIFYENMSVGSLRIGTILDSIHVECIHGIGLKLMTVYVTWYERVKKVKSIKLSKYLFTLKDGGYLTVGLIPDTRNEPSRLSLSAIYPESSIAKAVGTFDRTYMFGRKFNSISGYMFNIDKDTNFDNRLMLIDAKKEIIKYFFKLFNIKAED